MASIHRLKYFILCVFVMGCTAQANYDEKTIHTYATETVDAVYSKEYFAYMSDELLRSWVDKRLQERKAIMKQQLVNDSTLSPQAIDEVVNITMDVVRDSFKPYLSPSALREAMISYYATVFPPNELAELHRYFSSASGEKLLCV